MLLSEKICQKATAEYHSIQLSGAMGGVIIIEFSCHSIMHIKKTLFSNIQLFKLKKDFKKRLFWLKIQQFKKL